jgi:hypothetical protein
MSSIITERDKKATHENYSWDDAIKDAKRHIRALQNGLRHLREMKASGRSWPGSEKSVNSDQPTNT